MNKTVRNLERCKDCGDGKFVDEKCKCLKPLLIKKTKFKIPCQFCREIQDRETNWKLLKITCYNCKTMFGRENALRRRYVKRTLKMNRGNYKTIVGVKGKAPVIE